MGGRGHRRTNESPSASPKIDDGGYEPTCKQAVLANNANRKRFGISTVLPQPAPVIPDL